MSHREQNQGTYPGPTDPNPVVHLPVLPHSGKVEELRRQMQAERESEQPTADHSPTPEEPSGTSSGPEGAPGTVAATAGDAAAGPAKSIQRKLLEGKVIEVLRQVYDPEIPVNIYDLGLIYEIDAAEDNTVKVKMTLTAPACPVAGTLPGEVERRIENIPDVKSAEVELVWDPPWDRNRMSEAAQLQLGFF